MPHFIQNVSTVFHYIVDEIIHHLENTLLSRWCQNAVKIFTKFLMTQVLSNISSKIVRILKKVNLEGLFSYSYDSLQVATVIKLVSLFAQSLNKPFINYI